MSLITTATAFPHDEECMRAAIEESVQAVRHGHMPFGAVIADSAGTILVRGQNLCTAAVGKQQRGGGGRGVDVTRHAEVEVVRTACLEIDANARAHCTLYASTEPCVMCAGAIYWSNIGRVVYGCSSAQLASVSGPGGFDIPLPDIYAMGRDGTRSIRVDGPLLSDEAMQVHRSFWNTVASDKSNESLEDLSAELEL